MFMSKALNLFKKMSKPQKSKYFCNNLPDFTTEHCQNYIVDGEINKSCVVCTCLKDKWSTTVRKFDYLDYNDYSVYTGTAGIALLKLRHNNNDNDKKHLKDVKNMLSLQRLRNRRHTFLCGDAGPLAIGAVVCHKLDEKAESKKLIDKLLNMKHDAINVSSDLPNEYLYGRAGYLFALLYVNKHIPDKPIDDNEIRQIIEAIFMCGQNQARADKFVKTPLMYEWHESYYLGAAHGMSGILYLLLQIKEYLTKSELNDLVKPTIDYLTTLRFKSGNFPSSLGSESDKYVQWCHGAPGFAYLFCMAFKVFGDPKYLQIAEECGDIIWERGLLKKGYSLCHGVSGNAYCFLELYQTTKDSKHLYRALQFAEWCANYSKEHEEYPPDRPLSLYEGIAGPMYLLVDIQDPLNAKFPGYTL